MVPICVCIAMLEMLSTRVTTVLSPSPSNSIMNALFRVWESL
uniref:Uncharacterized protein n=1 Tax=Arundo donax TaxID=35708 RepID=A0A0A9HRF8_ARUDO